MEKVININFQGRVISIEETAYEALKQYVDALRRHFVTEESSEEIISDIENRIAELLAERLKQGTPCINTADLNAVIDNIGRLEDIAAADGEDTSQQQKAGTNQHRMPPVNNRLFRNADDKVIAGVCSGLAIRMNIDPIIVRILFVVLSGALLWVYILLWIIVPMKSLQSNITHRFFRDPDDKMLGGVCGGLANYFKMDSWKIRLLFIVPLIFSSLFAETDAFAWHFRGLSGVFFGSMGGTAFILYIILWIAVPFASSDTDKMEMRGEKIDINSIKAATQARSTTPPPSRPVGSSLGKVIAVLFKAFFLIVAGSLALGLFGALIGIVFAGTATVPYADFFINGTNEYAIAWTAVGLTLGIPLMALIVWIIRRVMGVRTRHHSLAYVFAGLWITGVVCTIYMTGNIISNFRTKSVIETKFDITQPTDGKLYIKVDKRSRSRNGVRHSDWHGHWDENDGFCLIDQDSLWLNTVRVNIEESPDSMYGVYIMRTSRGKTAMQAKEYASHFRFTPRQSGNVVSLPGGFTISNKDKFRNQQAIVTIEVPIGKSIEVSRDVNAYNWFEVDPDDRRRVRLHWRHGHGNYRTNREYTMTHEGLKKRSDIEEDMQEQDSVILINHE